MPFDTYCQSMQEDIDKCVCNEYCLYWPLVAAKDQHFKAHKQGKNEAKEIFEFDEVLDEFNPDNDTVDEEKDIGFSMPVFENIRSHLVSPFVSITDAITE